MKTLTQELRAKFDIEVPSNFLHTKNGGTIAAGTYYVYRVAGNKMWLGKDKVCVGMCVYTYNEADDSLDVEDAYPLTDGVDLKKVNAELATFTAPKAPKAKKARKVTCGAWKIDEEKMTATSPKGRTWKITEIVGEFKWAIMSKTGIEGFVVRTGYSNK